MRSSLTCAAAIGAAFATQPAVPADDPLAPEPAHASKASPIVRAVGVSAVMPTGWTGRIRGEGGQAVLEVATFRLSPSRRLTSARLQRLAPDEVAVVVAEVGNRPGTAGFTKRRRPPLLRASDVQRGSALGGRPQARLRFAVNRRSFSVVAVFGRPPQTQRLADVNLLLSSLRISPPRGIDARTRRHLRRALHLPRGTPVCPRSPAGRPAPAVSTVIGGGPAYPALGGVRAQLDGDRRIGRWFAHKTLWAVAPRYRGPLLIRGRRLDEAGVLRFGLARHSPSQMWWPAANAHTWRYRPSTTVIPAPGCYAFQVDGITFSRVLVFETRFRSRNG
jgi:hypothetical protein